MIYTYNDLSNTQYTYDSDVSGTTKYINISDSLKSLQVVGPNFVEDTNSLVDNLVEISHIDGNIEKLEDHCFYNCRNVSSANLNKVTNIGDKCFENCSSLVKVDIFDHDSPSTLYTIGDSAFANSGLQQATIMLCGMTYQTPEDYEGCVPVIKSLGPYAGVSSFANCKNLTDVTLCCSTDVGNFMFANCTALSNVQMANHGSCVGVNCFENCSSLKKIVLPSHFEIFSKNMFKGCANLQNITILDPDSDKSKFMALEDYCLSGCSQLSSMTFPRSISSIYTIDDNDLSGSSLKEIHFTGISRKQMNEVADTRLTTQSFSVDRTTTTNFKYGTWYGNCAQLISFAKKLGAPMLLYECNAGCGRCSEFGKKVLPSKRWIDWMSTQNMFFAYGKTEGGDADLAVQQVRWDIESVNGWTYYPQELRTLPGLHLVWWKKNATKNTSYRYAIDVASIDEKTNGVWKCEEYLKKMVKTYFSSYDPDVNCMIYKVGELTTQYTLGNIGHDATLYAYDGKTRYKYTWSNAKKRIYIG